MEHINNVFKVVLIWLIYIFYNINNFYFKILIVYGMSKLLTFNIIIFTD